MIQQKQVYRCGQCSNTVEVLFAGGGDLTCCSKPMAQMSEKSGQEGQEKHVPVIHATDAGVVINVGSNPHPMQTDHFIEWVEVCSNGRAYRQYLKPDGAPEATFNVPIKALTVRAFCNKHGLWAATFPA